MKKKFINLNNSTRKVGTVPRGRNGGRSYDSNTIINAEKTKKLYELGVPVIIICNDLKISRSTLYRYLNNKKLQFSDRRNRKKKENQ